ncbi:MAG TPA: alkaline phosphatase family protein [Gaiellaceae bacterium]|nr:alkaline phosphatase family protein [Gaiellaceae bacterium]
MRWLLPLLVGVGIAAAAATATSSRANPPGPKSPGAEATKIKHLVVIFQENVSFDHYFGTYPHATNSDGQPWHGAQGAKINGLYNTPGLNGQGTLLTNNPNNDADGNQVNPRRLDPADINDVLTCDQDHDYNDEQKAFDNGNMDKFVTSVGTGPTGSFGNNFSPEGDPCNADMVMNYYDGNTVTGMWNYAKNFGLSDNFFGTTFGPSAPGAINLVSGDTGNVGLQINGADTDGDTVSDGQGGFSLVSDAQPYYDDCSTRDAASLTGKNIGDELNAKGLSWGWFQGGFSPTTTFAAASAGVGQAGQSTATFTPDEFKGSFTGKNVPPHASNQGLCDAVHPVGVAVGGDGQWGYKDDYIPHHEPFQYYESTANPHHLAPTSLSAIGTDTQSYKSGVPQFDTANHQYDTSDFNALLAAINHGFLSPDHLPAVSFLKAPGYEDGHAAYSDPFDEQEFVTSEINALEQSPDWSSTAVIITYDDSDGFYDHVYSGVHNPSAGVQDFLTGTGLCGTGKPLAGQDGRCGYGPRLPLLLISPWAKQGDVSNTLTDFSSIDKFIEDNWGLPRIQGSFDSIAGSLNSMFDFHGKGDPKLFLDPNTGQPENFGPGQDQP